MFLFEKKIVYLTFFWDGVKKSSAGFVRIAKERDACILDIHIKRTEGLEDGDMPLLLVLKDKEISWGFVTIKGGEVAVKKRIPLERDILSVEGKEYREEELCGILIRMGSRQEISGYWQELEVREVPLHREKAMTEPKEEKLHAADHPLREEDSAADRRAVGSGERKETKTREAVWTSSWDIRGEEGEMLIKSASGNKWEQLQSCYRKIHPFGDDRIFLSIEPKDFVILRAPYQRLVNNSFLLHGFYNYRHLLLGPDEELGNSGDTGCYYLGVPGTYFEREKMVAVMFGFEGFECSGPVEIGKFGYYMRRVEI